MCEEWQRLMFQTHVHHVCRKYGETTRQITLTTKNRLSTNARGTFCFSAMGSQLHHDPVLLSAAMSDGADTAHDATNVDAAITAGDRFTQTVGRGWSKHDATNN